MGSGSHRRLYACQALLLNTFKLLVMMTVAIILGGDPKSTTYIWAQMQMLQQLHLTGVGPASTSAAHTCSYVHTVDP